MPGVLKNALDWLSRPGTEGRSLLDGKPVAVIGASMGPFGTVRAQLALRQVLHKVNARVVAQPEVMVPLAHQVLIAGLDPASVPSRLLSRLLQELHDLTRAHLATSHEFILRFLLDSEHTTTEEPEKSRAGLSFGIVGGV